MVNFDAEFGGIDHFFFTKKKDAKYAHLWQFWTKMGPKTLFFYILGNLNMISTVFFMRRLMYTRHASFIYKTKDNKILMSEGHDVIPDMLSRRS